MQDGENTTNNNEFQIKSFLDENSNLLTIMGVFGALSVYLSNLSQSDETPILIHQLGIMASLFLFILISLTILYNAFNTSGSDVDILQSILQSLSSMTNGNITRIVFITSFAILCMAISYPIFSTIVGNILFGFILMPVALIIFVGSGDKITKKYKPTRKNLVYFIYSIIVFIFSYFCIYYIQMIPFTLFFISLAFTSAILMLVVFVDWMNQLAKGFIGLANNIFNYVKLNIKR